ncbi:MAG: sirohydrochlorin cobaltochelatase [Ruminococcus sp.]
MSDTAKKGILVVSFGTSHEDTRAVTIDAIEKEIGAAFTDCKVYRAWTSKMILARIAKRDHIHYDNVAEAMERMRTGWNHRCDRPAYSCNERCGK